MCSHQTLIIAGGLQYYGLWKQLFSFIAWKSLKNRAKKSPLQLCKLTRFSCWASTGILFWHSVTTGKQNERKASKNQIQDYRTGYQFYLVLDILRSRLALTFNYERLWSAVCSKSLISHLIKSKNYVKRGSTACQESSVQ